MSIDSIIEESKLLKCMICHRIIATGVEKIYEAAIVCANCFRRYITTE
jgi:hypothetical protein